MGTCIAVKYEEKSIVENIQCQNIIDDCYHLQRFLKTMLGYNSLEIDNLSETLDDFLHLMHHHSADEEFEYIYNELGLCNITVCQLFNRRINSKRDNNLNICDQIVSKMHSYYQHCFDIGNRLLLKEIKNITNVYEEKKHDNEDESFVHINHEIAAAVQILTQKRMLLSDISTKLYDRVNTKYNQLFIAETKQDKKFKSYSFGIPFKYEYPNEHFIYESIPIKAKYKTFKQEMTDNNLAILTIHQFDNEYQKAKIHFHSKHCKDKFMSKNKSNFLMEYVLALMIYCKTYRTDNGVQHNEFYFF
eukprot:523744_1